MITFPTLARAHIGELEWSCSTEVTCYPLQLPLVLTRWPLYYQYSRQGIQRYIAGISVEGTIVSPQVRTAALLAPPSGQKCKLPFIICDPFLRPRSYMCAHGAKVASQAEGAIPITTLDEGLHHVIFIHVVRGMWGVQYPYRVDGRRR